MFVCLAIRRERFAAPHILARNGMEELTNTANGVCPFVKYSKWSTTEDSASETHIRGEIHNGHAPARFGLLAGAVDAPLHFAGRLICVSCRFGRDSRNDTMTNAAVQLPVCGRREAIVASG